jgi:hypothetical protein
MALRSNQTQFQTCNYLFCSHLKALYCAKNHFTNYILAIFYLKIFIIIKMKLIFLVFIIFQSSQALKRVEVKNSNYCLYSSTCIDCNINKQLNCMADYSYWCVDNLCSKNMWSCQHLKFWAMSINKQPNGLDVHRNLNKFGSNFKECPDWRPNNVCLKNKSCHQKQRIPFGLFQFKQKYITLDKCKCPSKHSIVCQNFYCALDEASCYRFNKSSTAIKNCFN